MNRLSRKARREAIERKHLAEWPTDEGGEPPSSYVNDAGILASDFPAAVVMKLDAAWRRAQPPKESA